MSLDKTNTASTDCDLIMNSRYRLAPLIVGLLVSTCATALDLNVVGLFPNKAVVQIEGGALQTVSVGQKIRDEVMLVSVDRDCATFDIEGQRVALALNQARRQMAPSKPESAIVPVDDSGRLVADGEVNGAPIRFAVDTGASLITLPAREAMRLGLNYRSGRKVVMETANGDVLTYSVKLDTVRIGEVVLHGIDAVVTEGSNLRLSLLGMNFLNRMDIRREGTIMTLTKRY
jgi:aspartyl protease family protein